MEPGMTGDLNLRNRPINLVDFIGLFQNPPRVERSNPDF
jgi:hypothetical protein